MLKLKIICLGKLKEKAFADLEREYLKRLSPFAKLELIELAEVSYKTSNEIEKVKSREAQKIKKYFSDDSIIILLEESGTTYTSLDFANFLSK